MASCPAETDSCWVLRDIRIDDRGISTLILVHERIMEFDGRVVTTWHAPGCSLQQMDAIVDACWRLRPGLPLIESLDERHLYPLLEAGYLSALDALRLLAGADLSDAAQ